VAGGAAAVVALGAAGAWGVASFMSGGTEAAEAVPDDALAYVSLNLDPDGGQKLDAYRTLKKFPALKKYLDKSGGGTDLRRSLVEPLLKEADCPGVTFDDDIAPWLGNAIAVAAVPGKDGPEAAAFLQVTDESAAKAGIKKIVACDEADGGVPSDDLTGTAFTDGWVVVAKTDAKAQAVVDDAAGGTLADDPGYQKWVAAAGGEGIVTAYVDADAPTAALDAADGSLATLDGSGAGAQAETIRQTFKDFQGGAAAVRFDGTSLEAESAFGGLPDLTSGNGDNGLADLPDSTAVAFGTSVSDTFVQDLVDAYSSYLGKDEVDQFLRQGEQMTGLNLPEDLQAVLGDGIAVSLDGSADFTSQMSSPAAVPVGVRITGDPSEITPALDKVLEALTTTAGLPDGLVSVEQGDHAVGVALSPDRAKAVAGDGGLGSKAAFRDALPGLDKSGSGFYIGFDDGTWFDQLVATANDAEAEANLAPLHSLGIRSWSKDGVTHGLARLTTD
jgi:hypothetical protein